MAARPPVDWTGIFDRVKESVFFVLLEPKEDKLIDLQEVADRVRTVSTMTERAKRVSSGYCSTGFVLMSRCILRQQRIVWIMFSRHRILLLQVQWICSRSLLSVITLSRIISKTGCLGRGVMRQDTF